MQYFLVVKECIFVLMEIITINIEKDNLADLDLKESLYLKLINSENTKDNSPDFNELEKFDCIPHFKEADNALKEIKNNLITHNQIRSLIFEPFQLPIYNHKKIIKSFFKNKKIRLLYLK